MNLTTNNHVRLKQLTKLMLNNFVSSVCFLSKILQKSLPLFSKQQTQKNQQVKILKDMTKLFTLVTK